MRTVLSVFLSYCLLALGVATGQQRQSQARHRTVDELCRAVHAGDAQALMELRDLGSRGDVTAQFNLGEIYENSDGVSKNPELAAQWYRKAAEQGDTSAQKSFGTTSPMENVS